MEFIQGYNFFAASFQRATHAIGHTGCGIFYRPYVFDLVWEYGAPLVGTVRFSGEAEVPPPPHSFLNLPYISAERGVMSG